MQMQRSISRKEDIINNEVLAIKEIYPDIVEKFIESKQIILNITPNNNSFSKKDQILYVKLEIKYKEGYPKIGPDIKIKDYNYLSSKDIEEIENNLESIVKVFAERGEEMIFEILSQTQNLINDKYKEYFAMPNSNSDSCHSENKIEKFIKIKNNEDKDFRNEYRKLLDDNKKLEIKTNVNEITLDNEKFDFGSVCVNSTKSRFKSDFEILTKLGEGGGGVVYKVRNNYDTFEYAIKKIKINFNDTLESNRIIREIMLFSRLQHNNIAKYLQAWIEEDLDETVNFDEYDYNNDINEDTKKEIDKVEEIISQSDSNSVEKIESNSNLVFESNNKKKGINIWEEDEIQEQSDDIIEIVDESKKYESVEKNKKFDRKNCYLYIQMEFCEGQTLKEAIAKKSLDDTTKWDVISSLIDVINYIHEHKLIHRDIKPSNIFLDRNNNVKLGDFGLATLSKSKNLVNLHINKDFLMSKGGDILSCGVGTMYYCSPEQEKGISYDEKTDIFSLGIVIFELFFSFGSLMHRDIVLREIREKHSFPQDFIKSAPENVVSLVKSLTERDAKKRPSANDLMFSNLIPFVYNDNVLCAYFNKIIDKNKHKKLIEMLIQKKIVDKTENFQLIDYFKSLTNYQHHNTQKFQYVFLNHNRMLKTFIKVFEKYNVDMLNLSHMEVFDNNYYINCISKYNDPYFVKTFVKRNVIPSQNIEYNNLFINKEGQAFQTKNHIYKKLANFTESNKLIFMKSYTNEIFSEFNIYDKKSRESNELITSIVWKINNSKNIIFDGESFEKEMFEIIFECLEQLKLTQYSLKVNSSGIIDAIFDKRNIDITSRCLIINIFNNIKKENEIRKKLQQINLNEENIKYLINLKNSDIDITNWKKFPEFEKIYSFFMENFPFLQKKINFDIFYLPENLLYYSGMYFEILFDKTTIIKGGRIDNHFEQEENEENDKRNENKFNQKFQGVSFRFLLNELLKIQTGLIKKDEDELNYKVQYLLIMQIDLGKIEVKKEKDIKVSKENKDSKTPKIIKEIKETKVSQENFIKKMNLLKRRIVEELKENRDIKELKLFKETKDIKQNKLNVENLKESKISKENIITKDNKDILQSKMIKDNKDQKEIKDTKEYYQKIEVLNSFQTSSDFKEYFSVYRMKNLVVIKGILSSDKISCFSKHYDSNLNIVEENICLDIKI